MFEFKFLNLAKPKKVFEKLNKMDRKQAYTIGAIIVVSVVALLMFAASFSSEDNPMEGMNPRGYDLAAMPFVNDLAEQELLASRYPDMKGEGSSFLYTPEQKAQRQEEDEQNGLISAEDLEAQTSESAGTQSDSWGSSSGSSVGGSGYGRGRRGGGTGRAKTEIGTLSSAGMATSGGSGIGATWGPSVDNRGLQGQTGYVAPAQLKTNDARKTLGQFRTASITANRLRDNKNLNARKAMQGGHVQGSQAFGKDGAIDASKLGGLALDTSELPKTSDLGNLDDAVDNAVKDQTKPPEDKDDKLGFWEQLGQDMLRSFANGLVDAVTTGVGDSLKGWVNGNSASRAAGKQAWADIKNKKWDDLGAGDREFFEKTGNGGCSSTTWPGCLGNRTYGNTGKYAPSISGARSAADADARAKAWGTTKSPTQNTTNQYGQGVTPPKCPNGSYKTWNAEKQNWNEC